MHNLTLLHPRYQDPFEEYKTRQQNKRTKTAQAAENARIGKAAREKAEGDDINWFGVKVGTGNAAFGGEAGGGVGKYLTANASLKRPAEVAAPSAVVDIGAPSAGKKRKVGFGNFEGW